MDSDKGIKASEATALSDVSMDNSYSTVTLAAEQRLDADQQGTGSGEDEIRVLAYYRWESAECPEGNGVDFWLEAEREINAARSNSAAVEESAHSDD